MFPAEAFRFQPDFVRGGRLQPAFADVEYLVEPAGNVEAQCGVRVDVAGGRYLFVGHPAPRCEGEFEFVAVVRRPGRADDGRERRKFHLAYPGKLVAYLFLLEAELFGVGEVLPFASSANAEVLAKGFGTQGRFFDVADDRPLHETPAPVAYLHVHHVARDGERYEYDHIVVSAHSLAFGGQGGYFQPLDEGQLFLLSCHLSVGKFRPGFPVGADKFSQKSGFILDGARKVGERHRIAGSAGRSPAAARLYLADVCIPAATRHPGPASCADSPLSSIICPDPARVVSAGRSGV